MRIHYYSGSTLPSTKANAVHVMKMAQALTRAGHRVRLHAKSNGASAEDVFRSYGVKALFELSLSPMGRVRVVSGLIRMAHAFILARTGERPDLLYSRDIKILQALRFTGLPLFYESHQIPENAAERMAVLSLLASPQFGGMIVISHALKQDWTACIEASRARMPPILVAHDGADIPDAALPPPTLTKWPGRGGIPQIGYTGSLHPGRGIDMLMEIASRMPEIDLHIVGGAPDDVERWQRANPPFNVVFHGHVPHRMLPAYLDRFDAVLAPYQARIEIETGADIGRWISPMKLFEYMAHKKAIVCSDLPVLREVVTHGRHALMVSPTHVAEWVDAITAFLHHPDLRDNCAQQAFAHLAEHYTWDSRARHITGFIGDNIDRIRRGR